MKGQDLLVLTRLLECSSDSQATYRSIAEFSGLSPSVVFESIERCFEIGLIENDRRGVRVDKLTELLLHALPYLLPSRVGRPSRGFPLTFQSMEGGFRTSSPETSRLVWQTDDAGNSPDSADGLAIEPVTKNLVTHLRAHPRLIPFFSCVEVLRLVDHPFKPLASQAIRKQVERLMARAIPAEPRPADSEGPLPDAVLDIATHYIASNGFKSTSFDDLATVMGVSRGRLVAQYGNETGFFRMVTDRATQVAGQYIGKVLLSGKVKTADFKESYEAFLGFIERNRDFGRLILWCYLESELDFVREFDANFNRFFDLISQLIPQTTGPLSEREQRLRAYLFITSPQWLATLVWFEGGRFEDQAMVTRLRADFRDFLTETIFSHMFRASPK